jgi:hypothetical protein
MTVLDAIIQSLSRASEYSRDDQVALAVILWPDKERQWEPVLPVLREIPLPSFDQFSPRFRSVPGQSRPLAKWRSELSNRWD